MRIAIIIPFYNGNDLIEACISSIFNSDIAITMIYVVDNSTKPSILTDLYGTNQKISIIKTKPSIGFGRACNIGIYSAIQAKFDIGIIMNQDAIFDSHAIQLLADQAIHKDSFGTVPISYQYDFSFVHPKIIANYLQPVKGFMEDKKNGQLGARYKLSFLQANGSCVAFNLENIKDKAWFDPSIHMYGEDVELFKRYTEQDKLSLFLVPEAKIGHIHSNLTDTKNRNKIDNYSRFGWQVIYLKDKNFTKVFITTFHPYLIALRQLNFDLIGKYISSDISLVPKFPTIIKSSNSNFLINRIHQFIKNDQYEH